MEIGSIIDELSLQYEVDRGVVEQAIACTLTSPAMQRITGAGFAELTDKGLIVYGDHGQGNIGIPKRSLFRALIYELEKRLQDIRTVTDYDKVFRLRGDLVKGYIDRKSEDGSLIISLPVTGIFGEVIDEHFAVCPVRNQPPHERGIYGPGQTRIFHVDKVLPIRRGDGSSAVLISLSRTTQKLPAILLAKEVSNRKDIRCTKRIVGKISYIQASEQIPKEAILKVGKELNERISVQHNTPR